MRFRNVISIERGEMIQRCVGALDQAMSRAINEKDKKTQGSVGVLGQVRLRTVN